MPFGILIAALLVLFGVWAYRRYGGAKEKSVHARVLGREEREHRAQGKDDDSLPTDHVVRFDVAGKELALIVSRSMYESAKEGVQGTLQYKGGVFIDFEPDEQRPW